MLPAVLLSPLPPAAEFSGFLLYKELGRRLQKSNPVVAEIFTLLARDEARHAGFINKALSGEAAGVAGVWLAGVQRQPAWQTVLAAAAVPAWTQSAPAHAHTWAQNARSARLRPWTDRSHALPPATGPPADFNLALDLGFLTKNRTYTFFKPKFIIYATYLSEKIGYWRYISMYRHLQRNPDNQLYPMFEYFENWCQDENRHGDFLTAVLKARPELLNGLEAR